MLMESRGKLEKSQGKDREKSGNYMSKIWQTPCRLNLTVSSILPWTDERQLVYLLSFLSPFYSFFAKKSVTKDSITIKSQINSAIISWLMHKA